MVRPVPCSLAALLLAAGCAFDPAGLAPIDGGDTPRTDAAVNQTDGMTAIDAGLSPDGQLVDAAPSLDAEPPPAVGDHLLITEVKGNGSLGEFVEIYNPTAQTIELDNYYLSDHQDYALLPALGTSNGPKINLPYDFIVRFPSGSSIAPRQVITVALKSGSFFLTYGFGADYTIDGLTGSATAAMRRTMVGAAISFTDSGEAAILFYWDGQTDLVKDVDIAIAGHAPSDGNKSGDKTDLQVDGPDGDTATSTYADDADTIDSLEADSSPFQSYKRLLLEGSDELHDGTGNGLGGHDETSEVITTTWDNATTFSAPTPGTVSAVLNP